MPITKGTIIRVAGAVLDLRFTPGEEPAIHALVTTESGSHHMEVFSHLGDGVVRCVALEATEGLRCGLHVESDGTSIKSLSVMPSSGAQWMCWGVPLMAKGQLMPMNIGTFGVRRLRFLSKNLQQKY